MAHSEVMSASGPSDDEMLERADRRNDDPARDRREG